MLALWSQSSGDISDKPPVRVRGKQPISSGSMFPFQVWAERPGQQHPKASAGWQRSHHISYLCEAGMTKLNSEGLLSGREGQKGPSVKCDKPPRQWPIFPTRHANSGTAQEHGGLDGAVWTETPTFSRCWRIKTCARHLPSNQLGIKALSRGLEFLPTQEDLWLSSYAWPQSGETKQTTSCWMKESKTRKPWKSEQPSLETHTDLHAHGGAGAASTWFWSLHDTHRSLKTHEMERLSLKLVMWWVPSMAVSVGGYPALIWKFGRATLQYNSAAVEPGFYPNWNSLPSSPHTCAAKQSLPHKGRGGSSTGEDDSFHSLHDRYADAQVQTNRCVNRQDYGTDNNKKCKWHKSRYTKYFESNMIVGHLRGSVC